MSKWLVLLLLCVSSAHSVPEMNMEMSKDSMSGVMPDSATLMDSVKSKLKRYSVHPHPTPCPPLWPQYQMYHQPKLQYVQQPQYVHKPAVTVVKTHAPIVAQPNYGWNYKQGWQKPTYTIQKPVYSIPQHYPKPMHQYVPTYHTNFVKPTVIAKPDCPPEHPALPHTGIVYAPQQQYHHQPQIKYVHSAPTKIIKPAYHPAPAYHAPQPIYHQPAPTYYQPSPVYHQPAPMHYPKVDLCD